MLTPIRMMQRPLFPGYLFAFVPDFARHWELIKECPGVLATLRTPEGGSLIVPDRVIDQIMAIEIEESLALHMPMPRYKKRGFRKQAAQVDDHLVIERISTPSRLAHLADGERIALLHRVLGLV